MSEKTREYPNSTGSSVCWGINKPISVTACQKAPALSDLMAGWQMGKETPWDAAQQPPHLSLPEDWIFSYKANSDVFRSQLFQIPTLCQSPVLLGIHTFLHLPLQSLKLRPFFLMESRTTGVSMHDPIVSKTLPITTHCLVFFILNIFPWHSSSF